MADVDLRSQENRAGARRGATTSAAGVVVGCLAAVAFVALSAYLQQATYLPGEVALTRAIQMLPWAWFGWPMVLVSELGYQPYSILVPALAFLGFVLARRRSEALVLVVSLASSPAGRMVKDLVDRERPGADLFQLYQVVDGPSFPSGHVVFYVTFLGLLFYLAWTTWRPSPWRTIVLVLTGALLALVGLSRVYLGAHFPGDVLGGYLLGGLWLWGTVVLYRLLRPRRL